LLQCREYRIASGHLACHDHPLCKLLKSLLIVKLFRY
jgi:hypothetical protein